MNKYLAIFAFVVVACAVGATASICMGEYCDWHCGAGGNGHASIHAKDAELKWSNENDKICKKTCKGTYPNYKKGNWGLFTEALLCCCNSVHLFGDSTYYETSPHISREMAYKLGISGYGKPTD